MGALSYTGVGQRWVGNRDIGFRSEYYLELAYPAFIALRVGTLAVQVRVMKDCVRQI